MSYRDDTCSTGPYRSRRGLIFGVCRGLAEYFNCSVFWTRVIVVVAFLMTGFWPVGAAYLVAAVLMTREPWMPLESPREAEFYASCSSSRGLAANRLKRTFESLDRRIRRMEDAVTARDFDWDERLNNS